jgi:hypothetical protein
MPNYQPLYRYKNFNILRYWKILYSIRRNEPPSPLLPALANTSVHNLSSDLQNFANRVVEIILNSNQGNVIEA